VIVNVKRLSSTAKLPTRGSDFSAGYDLYASLETDVVIYAETRELISTNIALEIPTGYAGIIKPRSGLALRFGIDVLAGVIDSDYRGPVGVILHNEDGDVPFTVSCGDRIAQIVFIEHGFAEMVEVEDFSDTERGSDGFGSTGE
jgi:dUTP pyrophosphatase